MFCSSCGTHLKDGAHFCENCGAQLQAPGAISYQPSIPATPPRSAARRQDSGSKTKSPYEPQIKQLKLQIRQLKLDLKQVNTEMSHIRSQYNQTSAFVPHGLLHEGYKGIEDARLWGPQKKKEQLQQQIIQLEQQLLDLEQQQAQWQQ